MDLPELKWINRRGARGFYSWSALRPRLRWTMGGVTCCCVKYKRILNISPFFFDHTTCKKKNKMNIFLLRTVAYSPMRRNESNGSNPTKQNQRLGLSDCICTVWLSLFLCCVNSSRWTAEGSWLNIIKPEDPRASEQKLCTERKNIVIF